MMKHLLNLTIATVLCANQAAALSCVRPDVARSYQWASDAEESYIVLLGEFAFTAPARPRGGDINNRQSVSVAAQFNGSYLGADGFVEGGSLDVTLNFICAGAWCGSLEADKGEVLAFVEQTAEGYTLNIGPCGGKVFGDPNDGPMQRVEACMRGEGCEEMDRLR